MVAAEHPHVLPRQRRHPGEIFVGCSFVLFPQPPEMIRLSEIEKLSQREIAKRLGLSKTTVNEILKRRREQTPGSGPSSS